MSQSVATHIELRPNRSNQPRAFISGTRTRVQDVYALAEIQGKSPEAIAQALPHLTLGQIHAAISYYFDHREDILCEMREDEEFVGQLRTRTGPGAMEQRLNAVGPPGGAISAFSNPNQGHSDDPTHPRRVGPV